MDSFHKRRVYLSLRYDPHCQFKFRVIKTSFTTAKRANQGEIFGFKFRLQNRTVFLNEKDLNTALHFPTENFEDYPTNEEP